jgi:hypothetical protein
MKGKVITIFLTMLVFGCSTVGVSSRQQQNLSVNPEVTAKIRAFDRAFFNEFDVYSAGVREEPTALLFDLKKDEYHLPSRFWGSPLSEEEIIYAIERLDKQYSDMGGVIPFEPRALNIINYKGEVVGYTYTGLNIILMDRKKDGQVTVFPPATPRPREPRDQKSN